MWDAGGARRGKGVKEGDPREQRQEEKREGAVDKKGCRARRAAKGIEPGENGRTVKRAKDEVAMGRGGGGERINGTGRSPYMTSGRCDKWNRRSVRKVPQRKRKRGKEEHREPAERGGEHKELPRE